MAEGNWSVIRVEKISAEGAQKTERHNERKNESYANLNVDTEQIARNVHFKDTGGLTYNEYFQLLIDEGKISTRGQKAGATIFNELVIDVNTRYFEGHGGYEYAKQFYKEAYRFGCEIYGEENIVSAVMHADEINKAVSEELGKPVYHYHLHIVAIPTVRKEILWSKRCKDETLRGTVKEVINQVSHSKKWKNTVPLLDENGQQVISKYGKPMFRKSYSVLQDKLFEHMTEAGFSGFERGVLGSTAENLSSLDYQIQKDKERLADIQERIEAEQVRYEPAHEVHKTMATDFFPQRPNAHPMIYAYENTNLQYQGLLKVGYTAIDVDKRVAQQYPTKRPDGSVPYRIVYRESAMYSDGSSFTDHDVHRVLKRKQITGMGGEWFRCTVNDVRAAVLAVKNHTANVENRVNSFSMRPEQQEAVDKTAAYFQSAYEEDSTRYPKFCGTVKCASAKPLRLISLQNEWDSSGF